MADENREIGQHDIKILISTVNQVKKYLDGELAKYKHLDGANKFISSLFVNEGNFQQSKQKGVGQTTILKFLGGNWKQAEIQLALRCTEDIEWGKMDIERTVFKR